MVSGEQKKKNNMPINSYRDLDVWNRGVDLAVKIYETTKELPPDERYGLTSQMRRAAVSIPSNTAEGWGRHYPAEFIQFLRKSNGSRTELETQLIIAERAKLLNPAIVAENLVELEIIGKQLLNLERSLKR
jgi:four helix bundle protein